MMDDKARVVKLLADRLWFLQMSSRLNRTRRVESWLGRSSPAMASVGGKLSVLAYWAPDLRWWRELRPRMANTGAQFQELKPRGGSDDANRRPAESRLPFLRMDARLDVVRERYVPAKDEHVIRDSTRSSSLEFVARGLR